MPSQGSSGEIPVLICLEIYHLSTGSAWTTCSVNYTECSDASFAFHELVSQHLYSYTDNAVNSLIHICSEIVACLMFISLSSL